MKQQTQKTKVLFLIERDYEESNPDTFVENHIVAYFPEILEKEIPLPNGTKIKCFSCYSHVGQHSTGNMEYFSSCKQATPTQYKDLMEELVSIGYDLEVLNEKNVILNHIGEKFELYMEDAFAPFASFDTHEEAEKYAIDNGYEITAAID